jgi:flagellin
MTVINTNVNSLNAASALLFNERNLSTAMERLSTGKRINGAKDDAAGQAIASRMSAQIRGLDQAVRNANDGISMLQTADGAMEEVSNMLQRMRELAVQYQNETNASADLTALGTEYTALKTEIERINTDTTWNSKELFGVGSSDFQVGANSGDTVTVVVTDFSVTAQSISGSAVISALDTDIDAINDARSDLGAGINRLTYAANNSMSISTNTSASRSRIVDTDYAKTSAELARTQIIQQAATAMLAQANQGTQSVLALLK